MLLIALGGLLDHLGLSWGPFGASGVTAKTDHDRGERIVRGLWGRLSLQFGKLWDAFLDDFHRITFLPEKG